MEVKRLATQVREIEASTARDAAAGIALVGTYRARQLAWMAREGVYNWPVKDGDAFDAAALDKVGELWLYADAKGTRHAFAATFAGRMTRAAFLAAHPSYASRVGAPTHTAYYVFKATPLVYGPGLDNPVVLVRVGDFGPRTAKVRKAIEQYQADGAFAPLEHYLPTDLAHVPPAQLRVCEPGVQMSFLALFYPGKARTQSVPPGIVSGEMPIIDLFAGCGGMSLGFELAGFRPVLAIERDEWASETYSSNHDGVNVITGDITTITSPRKTLPDGANVFGVIGGPPCQGFSLSGGRDPKDPRNSLFMDYMRFVEAFHPSFFVMENVPGILSAVTRMGERVKDVVLSVASEIGYNVKVMLLDASRYGVPQCRQRVFFVGIRDDYPFDPDRLEPISVTPDHPVTVEQALSDLPVIGAGEGCAGMAYATPPQNDYQAWCRKRSQTVENHVAMRHTKRLVARFHVIGFGESAADVPREHMQRKRGNAAVISGKTYSQNNMRPFPDRPSPTVPASFQSNFVHPYYDRNYTAREGARLQSFPDSYIFKGRRTTMSWERGLSQYQQIGNAVPPLLAKALGLMVRAYFESFAKLSGGSAIHENHEKGVAR